MATKKPVPLEMEEWTIESVPDNHVLFVRVHNQKLDKKNNFLPSTAAFKNTPEHGPDLSSDWSKYSTPKQNREQIGREYRTGKTDFKNPDDFYIASFLIGDIISLNLKQKVEHSPRQENFPDERVGFPWNRAHCSIIGDAEERRLKMIGIAKWEIPPPNYNPESDSRLFSH